MNSTGNTAAYFIFFYLATLKKKNKYKLLIVPEGSQKTRINSEKQQIKKVIVA